jgi:hypothetical protein
VTSLEYGHELEAERQRLHDHFVRSRSAIVCFHIVHRLTAAAACHQVGLLQSAAASDGAVAAGQVKDLRHL